MALSINSKAEGKETTRSRSLAVFLLHLLLLLAASR